VKFQNQTQAYLLDALSAEGSQLTEDANVKFRVRLHEPSEERKDQDRESGLKQEAL